VHSAEGYPARWPDDPAGWLDPAGSLAAWVAHEDHRILGHLTLVAAPADLPAPVAALGVPAGRLAYVARLFVSPRARGQGLGRVLLATTQDEASAREMSLVLDVVDGAPAIRLYENLGWRRLGSDTARWTLAGGEHPVVHYYAAPR
jgi:GNAT superfamily N-acetyltransferase